MKKSKILIILFLILIASSSCKNWLYMEPEDGIVRQDFWQTKEDMNLAVFGVYASMLEPDMETRFFLWGELRADMVQSTGKTPVDYLNIVNGSILPDNKVSTWDLFYRTINLCNLVLKYAPNVKELDPTYTDEEYNGNVAEVLTIRSLMYFYLVRTFGEVPLKLDATLDDSKSFEIAKSSEKVILKQIIADLATARTKAVKMYNSFSEDKARVNYYTVNALLADVHLWDEQYDSCMNDCKAIMNSQKFGITDTSEANSWYENVFIQGNSFNESIFELQNNTSVLTKETVNSPFYTLFGSTPQLILSNQIPAFFMTSEEAKKPDVRGNYASFNFDNTKIWKFLTMPGNTEQTTGNARYPHWIFYRYADVLLMYVEALANHTTSEGDAFASDTTLAMPIIREIRFKRFADPITAVIPNTRAELNNYILNERAREFMYEGKRWFDVLRFTKRNNFSGLSIMKDMIRRAAPGAVQQAMLLKAEDPRSLYLPIYYNELVNNKLLIQNDFYNK